MIKSYLRGHHIIFINGEWIYEDNKEPTINSDRPCGHCEKEITIEGHDGCLGTLPGIRNACCGHGIIDDAYVQFQDMFSIHGKPARIIIERLIK